MSASHSHADMIPRGALIGAAFLVTLALVSTGTARLMNLTPAASPAIERASAHVAPISSRSLRFADRVDGAVVITDAPAGSVTAVIPAGQQTGFIRGVMRGLARDRRMRGIGDRPPFTLTLWKNGELTLLDTATGREIELTAFGASNRAAFAALLEPGASS